MRYIVLDTETTGLDPKQGHRIIEIAALELKNRQLTKDYRHFFINPERSIDEAALKVHGITSAFLADKPRFADIAQAFLSYIKDATLIIHNAPFDTGFLNSEYARLNLGKIEDHVVDVIDTLAMAKARFPGKYNNLNALCDRFEINRANRILHGAMIDCELLAEVYFSMTRGQNSLFLDEATVQQSTAQFLSVQETKNKVNRNFIVQHADNQELAEHATYLDMLNQATGQRHIW